MRIREFWKWLIPGQAKDTSDEARKQLRRLNEMEREVCELSEELERVKERNNFSGMVERALRADRRGRGR